MPRQPKDPILECLDRLRRIETRFTSFMAQAGYDTGTQRCKFEAGAVIVPSPNTSLKDILATVPNDRDQVSVFCGEQYLGVLMLPQRPS